MVVFSIIGALIGAGFASGQEIYVFFYRFGLFGVAGIGVCSILMGLVIYKTFLILFEEDISDYKGFLKVIIKNEKLSKIINNIINIFLLGSFYIMISGFGAYFEQQFGISHIIGSLVLATLCFVVLLKNISGVTKINSIVVPVLILCIIMISFVNLTKNNPIEKINTHTRNWTLVAYTKHSIL